MKIRRRAAFFFAGAAMLGLILDGRTALRGASEGIELCLKTVIPALFPFFVCSAVLTDALWGESRGVLKLAGKLFRIPAGAESVLIPGFLGGYPAGAQCVARAWRLGQLDREEARRMLGFCSNPGPSFLFGIVGPRLGRGRMIWLLWGLLLLGGIAAARLLPGKPGSVVIPRKNAPSLTAALEQALRAMAGVCGWVVLFRVVLVFLHRLPPLPEAGGVLAEGLLELTNGCCALERVTDDRLRFLLAGVMLSLGGACVSMQTLSVTEGLPLDYYFLGKGIQCLFFAAASFLLFAGLWWVMPVLAMLLFFIPVKKEKGVAFSQ